MMNSNEEKKQLDSHLLEKLKYYIFSQEKENVKTKKKSDTEMIETIRKIITREVDANDNQAN